MSNVYPALYNSFVLQVRNFRVAGYKFLYVVSNVISNIAVIVKNYICRMYNHVRRCLFVSIKIRKTFLTQSIENVSSTKINYYIHHWNRAVYKRFCCQTAINMENNETNMSKNLTQQKFDQFLSNPENKKFYEILQLEISVLRSNGEIVPENIQPKDWLMLCTMKSRTKRK